MAASAIPAISVPAFALISLTGLFVGAITGLSLGEIFNKPDADKLTAQKDKILDKIKTKTEGKKIFENSIKTQ